MLSLKVGFFRESAPLGTNLILSHISLDLSTIPHCATTLETHLWFLKAKYGLAGYMLLLLIGIIYTLSTYLLYL